MKSLEKFYEDQTNINIFIPIINSELNVSIRLIDYFVTKYSKNNKVSYKIRENDADSIFNVYTSYKQQLKAFQKKHFDPFSRGDRIPYFMDNSCVITTIGQLNFFRWFISKKVYDYIRDNQDLIEMDMNKKNRVDRKKNRQEKKIKKNPKTYRTNTTSISTVQYKPSINSYTSNDSQTFTCSKPDKIIVKFSFN